MQSARLSGVSRLCVLQDSLKNKETVPETVPQRRLRYTPAHPDIAIQSMLDPRRIVRWVWLGRATLACAILIAAVFVWERAEPVDTLVATLAFACALLATVASATWAEVYRRPLGRVFYGLQCLVDLLVVTAIVHVTGGWSSQFAALYILVIATAALMLPFSHGLSVAGLACVFYAADVLWLRTSLSHVGVAVQLGVFAVVAVGSGFIAARLREAGVGRDALAAQLVKVQLEAADILRTIRSGIISVDADGNLLYANPAATELLGMHLRSLVGRPVVSSLADVSPQLASILESAIKRGVRTTRAEGMIRRDGRDIPIGVTTTMTDVSDEDSGNNVTAIFQDISDTKRLQAMHVRTERLEAVAELSASLAHEIKNPLASIRSATEQLSRRYEASRAQAVRDVARGNLRVTIADDDDDDERVLHSLVVREADRLSRLLTDFLDFARAQVARTVRLDAGEVVRKAAQTVINHPDRIPAIEVTLDIADESLEMDADDDQLYRAVFNLALNAVQAVAARPGVQESGGHVHIEVAVAREETGVARRRGIRWDGETISISVSDDGMGVPEEVRTRLFEPFVSTKIGGSGLGLPVVHRAVEAHQGVITVDSLEPGTKFTILMPRFSGQLPTLVDGAGPGDAEPTGGAANNDSTMTGAAA
jgi:two-component system sensor histidine kinase PilS (NtrC family)